MEVLINCSVLCVSNNKNVVSLAENVSKWTIEQYFLLISKRQWRIGRKVDSWGLNFISILCNCLWTIEGHQDTMTAHFCPFPSMFESLCVYNLPESPNMLKES